MHERHGDRPFATADATFPQRIEPVNVRAIDLPASANGVHRPRTRDDHRTAILGTQGDVWDT